MKFHPSTCRWPGAVSIGWEIYLNPCTNRIHRSVWARLTAYQDADGVVAPLQLVADVVPDSSLIDFVPCSLSLGHFLLPAFMESQFSALDRIWWDLEWFIVRSSSALSWRLTNAQLLQYKTCVHKRSCLCLTACFFSEITGLRISITYAVGALASSTFPRPM
jgi:hypothetical protein